MASPRLVSLNCDMGEGYGVYKMGDDEALMHCISLANVACGFHAGDPTIMAKTVKLARQYGVKVGAHPSLPDRQGFGRREMKLSSEELKENVIYQVGALLGFLMAEGMTLSHIKPHGSLYGMTARDEALANAFCDAVKVFNVPLMGMSATMHETVAQKKGIPFIAEFFADLEYDKTGKLIITREHQPAPPGYAAHRVMRALTERKVKSIEGVDIDVSVDSVCVHSDTPGALEIAKAVQVVINQFNSRT